MELKVYSIRDQKGGIFNQPFFCRSHGEAERNFTTLINDPKSMICKFREDFDLYHIGEYDDQTGRLTSLDTPLHILKAVAAKSLSDDSLRSLNVSELT